MAASGSTSLIKTLLDQYFNCIVYTPTVWMNYNVAIKIPLIVNQLSAWEDFSRDKNYYKLISYSEADSICLRWRGSFSAC